MAEKAKLELRRLQRGDEERLVDIYREVFGVELGVPYWRWKYFDNPFGDPVMYVALDGDRIVGEIGGILCNVRAGGKEALAVQVVDIVILPEYQKGGPFFKLEKLGRKEAAERGVGLSYAISIKKTYKISTRILKYKGVCPIKRYMKVLDPSPYLKHKMGPLGGVIGGAGKVGLKLIQKGRLSGGKGVEVREEKDFGPAFDELWEREAPNYEIAVVRRTPYLKWRYTDSPINDYRVIAAHAGGVLRGYMVLGTSEQAEVKRGRIVDLFMEKDNEDVAAALINHAQDIFYAEGCNLVVTWLPENGWLAALFEKARFAPKETPHDLIVRPEAGEYDEEYLKDPSNWHLSMGDSDYF